MNIQEYISSGILELYICGALSEKENGEVSSELKKHPEIEKEVEEIENALENLSTAAAPYNPEKLLAIIQAKLDQNGEEPKVIPIQKDRKSSFKIVAIIGWAASIALLIGLFSLLSKNNDLRNSVNAKNAENAQIKQELVNAREKKQEAEQYLSVYRDRSLIKVPLEGQDIAPKAYAAAYWDKEGKRVFVDAKDLPTPPEGMEYQVWSLKLDPLQPTSIGLLANFKQNDSKIFILNNPNQSQAFGITLEPKGGSKTPTMEKLYTMGAIQAS